MSKSTTQNTAEKPTETPSSTEASAPPVSWAEQVGTIVHVDPATLLLVRNVRQAQPDKGLIDSVRDVGVLEPITALVATPDTTPDDTDSQDGESLVVRFGHRRTLAAVEAGRETVPVYLAGTTDAASLTGEEDAAHGIARLIEQRDENTHRAGLSVAENVGVVGQLAAFGLSASQIAKRARVKRADVDAALTVAGSDLATGAAERWDDMTLDQLAVIADFEDDTEAVKALRAAALSGQFEHVAQQLRDKRAREQARQAVLAPLAEAGVTVIDKPAWHERNVTLDLDALRLDPHDEPGMTTTHPDGPVVAHAECPGHVAWADETYVLVDPEGNVVDEDAAEPEDDGTPEAQAAIEAFQAAYDAAKEERRWEVVYGCRDWQAHGHVGLWQRTTNGDSANLPDANLSPTEAEAAEAAEEARQRAEAEAEAKRANRRLVIDNNKAWDAATSVRRDWIKANLAARKTLPKGGAAFLVAAVARDGHRLIDSDADALAADWLSKKTEDRYYGYKRTVERVAEGATENRALVLALVHALAAIEASLDRMTWRRDNTEKHDTYGHGRYLQFLATCGYTLSDVEKYAVSSKTA